MPRSTAETLKGDFVMTYDNEEGVKELANKHGLKYELIAMKNTYHIQMEELLISRKLDWLIKY